MLRVGHENSGSNSRWLLDEVVIYSLARGERYVFKGGCWIGGRNNEIDLPLGELKSQEKNIYILLCFIDVFVPTSGIRNMSYCILSSFNLGNFVHRQNK